MEKTISIFWFRRDLRIEDNNALRESLISGCPVLPIFVFDTNIISELKPDDPRLTFIHNRLVLINEELKRYGSSLHIFKGNPLQVFFQLLSKYPVGSVYANRDYEPYALKRDKEIQEQLDKMGIIFKTYKDQVIFEMDEILKSDAKPYTIFTPYKNAWLNLYRQETSDSKSSDFHLQNLYKHDLPFPLLKELGFVSTSIKVKEYQMSVLYNYKSNRDIPSKDSTTYLGPHLRFGTVSIRQIIKGLNPNDDVFRSELIWREFFMQILYHFPHVVRENFKSKYNQMKWRNNEKEFERWCNGETGYPMVDAGMRQLNETGYMHNRVRMVVASFLCKHLLIDWRWGEAYFASKLLDYELSSNNGNWQWAASTGCDAVPYFRIFNPELQQKRFDPEMRYCKQWVPEFGKASYPKPVIVHEMARKRAIECYKDMVL